MTPDSLPHRCVCCAAPLDARSGRYCTGHVDAWEASEEQRELNARTDLACITLEELHALVMDARGRFEARCRTEDAR